MEGPSRTPRLPTWLFSPPLGSGTPPRRRVEEPSSALGIDSPWYNPRRLSCWRSSTLAFRRCSSSRCWGRARSPSCWPSSFSAGSATSDADPPLAGWPPVGDNRAWSNSGRDAPCSRTPGAAPRWVACRPKYLDALMLLTCPSCSRVNPDDALFCYHDGRPLGDPSRRARAVDPSRQRFPMPFVFPGGRACHTFDELALACHDQWESARDLLQD